MNSNNLFCNEQYFLDAPTSPPENPAAPVAPVVSHANEQMRPDSCGFSVSRSTIQEISLAFDEPSIPFTLQDHESEMCRDYQNTQINLHRHAGAKALLAYLHGKQKSLAEVTKRDLEEWALTPTPTGRSKGSLPDQRSFAGAQGLCVFAAGNGYIDAQRGKELAECERPQNDINALRIRLQNPALSRQEREYQIGFHYQSAENNCSRKAGALAFLAYLEAEEIPLAEVTKIDLGAWALTPLSQGQGQNNLPDAQAFEGAKALCVLAIESGHIQRHMASHFAECKRPSFGKDFLRTVLQSSGLTPKERDHQIRLNYQRVEKDLNRRAGANAFLAYLESQSRSLAKVSTSDLERWARTPIAKGRGKFPSPRAFDGAKALCAVAAEVGEIDAQRAHELALCVRPRGELDLLRNALQDPALTPQERDNQIRLHYRSTENDANRQAGASTFQAYLESQDKSLAEANTSDLKRWALSPLTTGSTLPSVRGFEGAKALCVLAGAVGYLNPETAEAIAQCPHPHFHSEFLRTVLQNPALTPPEREHQIRLNYQSTEKNLHFQAGANGFFEYLAGQGNSLASVTKSNLEEWALTPLTAGHGKGNLPNIAAFAGAKGLCALAAEVGYLDPQTAAAIAQCPRPRFDLEFLRTVLQNPALTPQEREHQIRLNYQSTEENHHFQAGANSFFAYLEGQGNSLAEVTKSDLDKWVRTPIARGRGKGSLPSERTFAGAKALIALAAEVGYIDQQRAQDIALYQRPRFDLDYLRSVLQDPAMTRQAREYHIHQSYKNTQNDPHRQAGAKAIVAYLASQNSSLATVTRSDLERWALTPIANGPGKGRYPSARAFEGAKDLCALAAEVGYIDAATAQELAEYSRSQQGVDSSRMAAAAHKRRRRDDQEASVSLRFALPQSDAWQRDFALSPPTFLSPSPHATSSQTGIIQSLVHDLEYLETLDPTSLEFYSQSLHIKATLSRLIPQEPEFLQRAKAVLIECNSSAYLRLLALEREVVNLG